MQTGKTTGFFELSEAEDSTMLMYMYIIELCLKAINGTMTKKVEKLSCLLGFCLL